MPTGAGTGGLTACLLFFASTDSSQADALWSLMGYVPLRWHRESDQFGTRQCATSLAQVQVPQLWHTSGRLGERQNAVDAHPPIQPPLVNRLQQSLPFQFCDDPNNCPSSDPRSPCDVSLCRPSGLVLRVSPQHQPDGGFVASQTGEREIDEGVDRAEAVAGRLGLRPLRLVAPLAIRGRGWSN